MFLSKLKPFQRLLNKIESLPRKIHNAASKINPIQEESLKETCMLVNSNDIVIGSASKRDCHIVSGDEIPLHRAFSVFLFNSKEELLVQKRSDTKITFPGCYTNSCCSHPLIDFQEEQQEKDALGVKFAAIRRLNHELGVPKEDISPSDLKYLTRIVYKSLGDGVWGEHEIDYILFFMKDVTIRPNPEEVSEIRYVARNDFTDFITNIKDPLTPWFRMIAEYQLKEWWDNLDSLDKFIDHKSIHSLK